MMREMNDNQERNNNNLAELILQNVENHRYEIINKIGEGSFGEIFTVKNRRNDKLVAMKIISLSSDAQIQSFENEVSISNRMRHSKYSKYLITFQDYFQFTIQEHDQRFGVMVMEKFEIDLMDFILKKGKINEQSAKLIFSKICKSVKQMHKKKIYHMDIKPENILLSLNNDVSKEKVKIVKLCDFGASTTKALHLYGKLCGTQQYIPPECFYHTSFPISSEKVDVWSLGVVLYSMLTGEFPFKTVSDIINCNFVVPATFSDSEFFFSSLFFQHLF